jgi:hypothetical protein
MACAYRASLGYPTQFVDAEDTEKRHQMAERHKAAMADMMKTQKLPEAIGTPVGV